jgi:hypothetical protein
LENQITSKKGIVYFVEINITKLSIGQREYILALVRDITEQKQTQEALMRVKIVSGYFWKDCREEFLRTISMVGFCFATEQLV